VVLPLAKSLRAVKCVRQRIVPSWLNLDGRERMARGNSWPSATGLYWPGDFTWKITVVVLCFILRCYRHRRDQWEKSQDGEDARMIKHKTSREVSMGSVLVVDHLPGVYRTAGGDGGASCKGNPGSTGRGHAPRRWSSPFKSLLSFKLRSGAAVCVDAMGINALQRTRDSFPKTKMELLYLLSS
jgi:hypothetical protein